MPFYEFECYDCRDIQSVMTSIEKRDDKQPCKKCGVFMERIVTAAAVVNANTGGRLKD